MGAMNDGGHFNGNLQNGFNHHHHHHHHHIRKNNNMNHHLLLNPEEEGEEDATISGGIQDSVEILLQGLGEDVNREGLLKTPLRVAKALRQGTRGYRQSVREIVQGALFPEAGLDTGGTAHAGGAGGLVLVRDLDLFSYCESCLLPFQVKCHVGYVPSGQRVVGLSKLSRVADVFAKRLQDPQRLADEICSSLQNEIRPAGVGVFLNCWHIPFSQVELNHSTKEDDHHMLQGWSKVSVSAASGVFEHGEIWDDFQAYSKFKVDKCSTRSSSSQHWCPSMSFEVLPFKGHKNIPNLLDSKISSPQEPDFASMIASVAAILQSLGEDPLRKELLGTPHRFVQWLMSFKISNMDVNFKVLGSERLGRDELRSELNLPFFSQCEHHLLPFYGVVHIGYYKNKGSEPIKRSILQSIAHFHGWKLQVQERLTRQIMETMSSAFGEDDVIVVVEANHTCMISRGIEKVRSSTVTIATMGRFSTDPSAKRLFRQTVSDSTGSGGR